jgi:SAM-dependent methyltransferase
VTAILVAVPGIVRTERFQDLLRNTQVLEFSRRIITENYAECAPDHEDAVRELLGQTFARLSASAEDEQRFCSTVSSLVADVLRKHDPTFWFNRIYQSYKKTLKPRYRHEKLKPLLTGQTVLDLGCGDGLLAARLHDDGYEVFLTDVLDYRHETARPLPFRPMTDPAAIPYSESAFDNAIAMAVLHHVEAADLLPLLAGLRRTCRRVIVEEDSYGVPADLNGLPEIVQRDEQLREFVALPAENQLRVLMFIDYFANAIAQGLVQMDMPFNFKTVREWQGVFAAQGFTVRKTLLMGFQPGQFNRSCHVWFVLD